MRARRERDTKRRQYRITDRDLEIVQAVWEARYLTNEHISRLFFRGDGKVTSSLKTRLRVLYDAGYLAKRAAYPNEPDIHFLGLRGRRLIAKTHQLSQEFVDKCTGVSGGNAAAPYLMMNHDLTLSSLYVGARLECRQHAFTYRWENARTLETKSLGLQPDAFLAVGWKGVEKAALLEFTSVLPSRKEMRAKIEAYATYIESRSSIRDFGVPEATILWMTTSLAKLRWLRGEINRNPYRDFFLVGLLENRAGFITRPVWLWSESDQPVNWLAEPERVVYES